MICFTFHTHLWSYRRNSGLYRSSKSVCNALKSQVWWSVTTIPTLSRLREEGCCELQSTLAMRWLFGVNICCPMW